MTGKIKSGQLLRGAQPLPCGVAEGEEPAGWPPFQGCERRDVDGIESVAEKELEGFFLFGLGVPYCTTIP